MSTNSKSTFFKNIINNELKTKTTLIAEQADKMITLESSLNEDIKLLMNEKEELLRIIREMEIEKKVNDDNKIKLVNLQQQHDLLIEKNGEIINQLETANQLKTQVEEILDRQNKKIEVLQKDKRPKITS